MITPGPATESTPVATLRMPTIASVLAIIALAATVTEVIALVVKPSGSTNLTLYHLASLSAVVALLSALGAAGFGLTATLRARSSRAAWSLGVGVALLLAIAFRGPFATGILIPIFGVAVAAIAVGAIAWRRAKRLGSRARGALSGPILAGVGCALAVPFGVGLLGALFA